MKNFWSTLEKPIAVLAPMEDVTDTVFRQIVVRCGRPQVFFTEFTSTDGMCSAGREAVVHRLQYTEVEREGTLDVRIPRLWSGVCRSSCSKNSHTEAQ